MTQTSESADAGGTWRAWRDYGEGSPPPMLQAALDCFVEHGYHGTKIRTVAARVGLSVPGLYHHYPSKHALLVSIVRFAMRDLLERCESALAEAGPSIEERFRLLIQCLVLFHAHRSDLAFIAASEIRSLEGEARSEHIASRDRQQRMVDEIIDAGVAEGVFGTEYPREASLAIVTMCTGVAQWYRLDGALTPEELALRYDHLARRALA
ncbi:TetR family transcriptional regulator [Cryobacterium sp. MLB-32]|uniref:TetR/AcrR family transcriptional regulator n=1 Tax=Cryobacterium sp. MLB-32 TaxID=1529318 RepID=UPI0004E77E88|nr:TetR/AcrR family transcriptional regulator [Cryobacterium sp. MLB-32]KFF60264.1 TetR family transcriptional regulator [Cryobacterium sp. MLB-32]